MSGHAKIDKIQHILPLSEVMYDNRNLYGFYAKDNVEIITGSVVKAVNGTEELESIVITKTATTEDRKIDVKGMFVAIGLIPQNTPFSDCIGLDSYGYADSDESCITKTDGIFVAGDCRKKKIRQVATACADGAIAALAACDYIDSI